MVRLGKIFHTVNIAYGSTMLCCKTAILMEWLRTFVPRGSPRNWFFWACRLMILANVLFYGAALVTCFVECIPIVRFWEIWRDGRCFNRKARDLTVGGINIAQDIFILLLPQRVIWSLNMTGARKIGVSIMFSVGLLAIIMAVGRLYAYSNVQYTINLGDNHDTTYTASPTFQWAMGEITCLLLVFTVPWVPRAFAGRPKPETAASNPSEWAWTRLQRRPEPTWKSGLTSVFSMRSITRAGSDTPARTDDYTTEMWPAHMSDEGKVDHHKAWAAQAEPFPFKPVHVQEARVFEVGRLEMVKLNQSGGMSAKVWM